MLFKKGVSVAFILLLIISISRCSYFFGEKEQVKVVKVDRASQGIVGCLEQTDKVIDDYFKDMTLAESLDHNVAELTSCYREALAMFDRHTKSGKDDPNEYSAEEVSGFLQKVYPGKSFSLGFIENALMIKGFLIGGSSNSVTRKEIKLIDQLLDVVGRNFIKLRPYRAILLDEIDLPRDDKGVAKFDQAFDGFTDMINEILSLIKPTKTRRNIDMMKAGEFLLREYLAPDAFEKKKPLLVLSISFKKLMLNQQDQMIEFDDLKFFTEQSIRTYKSIMEFHQFLKDHENIEDGLFNHLGTVAMFFTKIPSLLKYGDQLKGQSFDSLVRILDRSIESFRYATWRSDDDTLDMNKVAEVLADMEKAELMGKALTAATLSRFLKSLVAKWFIDPNNDRAEITDNKITYVEKYVRGWRERQLVIKKALEGRDSITVSELRKIVANGSVKPWLDLVERVKLKKWTENQRLYFTKQDIDLNYTDLLVSNSIFTEANFFMKRYQAPGTEFKDFAVTAEQTNEIYELLRILGLEMAFMDAREFNSGYRTFSEGNMFTTQSVNDQFLSVFESFELLSILYSADTVSQQMYRDIAENCKLDYKDVLRKNVVEPKCFRRFVRENFIHYFNQLEGVSAFWNKFKKKDQEKFLDTLEKAARDGAKHNRDFSMGDIRIMVSITYYLQSVFQNFDQNEDLQIKDDELVKAESHFVNFLIEYVIKKEAGGDKLKPEDIQARAKEYFNYIITWEEVPGSSTWERFWKNVKGGLIRLDKFGKNWIGYGVPYFEPATELGYLNVLNIFEALGVKNRMGQLDRIQSFLEKSSRELMGELRAYEHVPDCIARPELLFCQFAAMSNCSWSVYGSYLEWLKTNEKNIFSEEVDTVTELSNLLNSNKLFSTQCKFPYVPKPEKTQEEVDVLPQSDLPSGP